MSRLGYGPIKIGIIEIIKTAYPELAEVDITMQSNFSNDLGIDSLDMVELLLPIEEKFKTGPIDEELLRNVNVLGDLVAIIADVLYPIKLEYVDIYKILPHGPGIIMVDRVTSLEVAMATPQIRAIYNVSGSAWWARDHFPDGKAMMPEKLMGEGLSQTAGLLLYFLSGRKKEKIVSVGNGDYSVHKPAFPGDIVTYFVEKLKFKRGLYLFKGTVEVNGYKSFSQTVKLGKS